MTISGVHKNVVTYQKPLIFICQPLEKSKSTLSKEKVQEKVRKSKEKVHKPALIKTDSDDDNESEVDFEKDIKSDIDME